MPTCKSCNAKVLRTDAFCGACGEPVPGAKPLVPIRGSSPGVHASQPQRLIGAMAEPSVTRGAAQAAAVVAISEPEAAEPEVRGANQTAVRERSLSEPGQVVPLQPSQGETPPKEPLEERDEAEEPLPLETVRSEAQSPIPTPARDTSLPNIPLQVGPPILASDLLREQMRPSSPGGRVLRKVTLTLCVLGAAGALWAGGTQSLTLICLSLLACMALLAVTPMSYRSRAIGLVLLGGLATALSLWQQQLSGVAPEGAILGAAIILLSGSLLFRAYYRGAMLSRVAVAVGVVALVVWFVASGGHQSTVRLEGEWQSWGPAIAHMAFGLLALLSLMAFMESSTRGGTHVWAGALLVLYAAHIGLLIGTARWPLTPGGAPMDGITVSVLLTGLVGTIVASLALAQVFVVLYRATRSERRSAA